MKCIATIINKAHKTVLIQNNFDITTTESSRFSSLCILHQNATAGMTGISPDYCQILVTF